MHADFYLCLNPLHLFDALCVHAKISSSAKAVDGDVGMPRRAEERLQEVM